MVKTFLIGIKDVRLAFRDRAALILMLAAPFVLTVGLGLATGRFSGDSGSGLSDIPVMLVNQDGGQLGGALAEVFHSPELADLMEPADSSDPDAARRAVDEDEAAAAVIIPAGFTDSLLPGPEGFPGSGVVAIEVYVNPSRPTSAGVVQSIVDEFLSRVQEDRTRRMTAILQMLESGLLTPQDAPAALERMQGAPASDETTIRINSITEGGEAVEFDILAYLAPGMALMFLMFTVSYGGRSILAERAQGTLPRLLVSPTGAAQILGGKIFGIYLTGAAQVLILIGSMSLFFGLRWGDPLGVLALVLAAVFGATGWGMLITALARSPNQVGTIGTAVMLIFGILGGSFINLEQMHPLMRSLSRITPNAWSLDGFTTLALGGRLTNLAVPITALLVMGAVLFTVSVILFGRKNLVQR